VFPNAEKTSMVVRLTAAAGGLGAGRVLVSTNTFGVSAAVLREPRRRAEAGDPRSKLRTKQARQGHQQRRGHRLAPKDAAFGSDQSVIEWEQHHMGKMASGRSEC
jgi:hypothetical protein